MQRHAADTAPLREHLRHLAGAVEQEDTAVDDIAEIESASRVPDGTFDQAVAGSDLLHSFSVLGVGKTEAIDAVGRAAEDRLLLVGRRAGGYALKSVPEGGWTDAHLVDGIVALDHAAIGAE